MTPEFINVGLGAFEICWNPRSVLIAYGLGSCLGVGMYDPYTKIAGLLHAVLPLQPSGKNGHSPKYVDSGIRRMVEAMKSHGSVPGRIIIRVAGGAKMFNLLGSNDHMNIGERNILALHKVTNEMNLRVTAHDIGGNHGRTVRLYVADGRMTVKSMGSNEQEL